MEVKVLYRQTCIFRKHHTDVKGTVKEMLTQRWWLIQSPQQYLSIYKTLQEETSVL